MKQELFHIGTHGYGINILCKNIFVKDDVLFLLISLRNSSSVSYDLSSPRFSIESRRRTKRGLQYEKGVFPRQAYGLGTIAPGEEGRQQELCPDAGSEGCEWGEEVELTIIPWQSTSQG